MYTIYPYASRYNTVHNSETAKLLTEQLQQDPDIKDEIKWIIPSKRIVFKLFFGNAHACVSVQCKCFEYSP